MTIGFGFGFVLVLPDDDVERMTSAIVAGATEVRLAFHSSRRIHPMIENGVEMRVVVHSCHRIEIAVEKWH